MWTPRRLLLLIASAGSCLGAFAAYLYFLGWADGLPTLPEKYAVAARPDGAAVELPRENRIVRLLKQAFGDNCNEVKYRYTLGLQIQGMYLATEDVKFENGRVKIWPLSLAVFGKTDPRTGYPEIQTIHCDVASLTFDRRVETWADIGRAKIVAAEFASDLALAGDDPRRGQIHIRHNHATANAADDLIAKASGPIYFRDTGDRPTQPGLWTDRPCEVVDYQAQPPHVVKAQALAVFLAADALKPGSPAPAAKSSGKANGTVRRVELTDVHMLLTVDGSSDFLRPTESNPPRPARTAHASLAIKTAGTFGYDLVADRATFCAKADDFVEVVRLQKSGMDELRCSTLDLQFQKRTSGTASRKPVEEPAAAVHLQQVRATGRRVTLDSQSESLHLAGTEIEFNTDRHEAKIFGAPVVVVRDGNRIEAPSLVLRQLTATNAAEPIPLGHAAGPGVIHFRDPKSGRPATARWTDRLQMHRTEFGDQLTFTGAAAYEQKDLGHWLRGDEITLWMKPASAGAGVGARPQKLLVAGNVTARSPELVVDKTDRIVVWFQDASKAQHGGAASQSMGPASVEPVSPSLPGVQQRTGDAVKSPLQVSAESIDAHFTMHANAAQLNRVTCRRRVQVSQKPTRPDDRGLSVKGQMLDVVHTLEGNVLTISGTTAEPASVEVTEMVLAGIRIVCDQRDNHLLAEGAGSLRLQVSTTLSGQALTRPSEVVIAWSRSLDLFGNRVQIEGGVSAEQETVGSREQEARKERNRLLCAKMDVFLDRAVQFGTIGLGGTKGKTESRPMIRRVVCHRAEGDPTPVSGANTVWRDGKLAQFHRIDAPEITYDNDSAEVTAAGPGEVRTFEAGAIDPLASPAAASQPAGGDGFHLTIVEFAGRMRGGQRAQSASFAGPVRITHGPAEDPNAKFNPDRLPDGGFSLSCRTLELTSDSKGGRRSMTLVAQGKADVYARDFSGRADTIKYDEGKKQQIIFDSSDPSNPAVLYQFKSKGDPPKELMGKSIVYFRETREFRVISAVGSTVSQ